MTKTLRRPETVPPPLPEVDDATRREFMIGAAGLLLLPAACGYGGESGDGATPGETRTIEHALGTAEVPARARRAAVLGGFPFDCAAALDVPVVGVSTFGGYDYLQDVRGGYEEARTLGSWDRPNVESVALAEPDLIVGEVYTVEAAYEELSRIAPTVALPQQEPPYGWKEDLSFVARATGREGRGRRVVADYERRIGALRGALGDALEETEVSVVRAYEDGISIYLEGSYCGGILRDVGLPRPPSQRGEGNSVEISLEELERAAGDVIFAWSFGSGQEGAVERLRDRPLWRRLGAVRAGRAHAVGGHWYVAGPIGANLVLDDLERYLPEERP